MRLWAFIKVTLIGLKRDFPIMIFSFALFPILLSTLYGYFQRELFVPSNSMEKIVISIQDKDRTKASEELAKFLKSPGINDYVELKSKNTDVEINIPKGYESGLMNNENVSVAVNYEDEKKDTQATIVASILDRYHERLQEQVNLQKKISSLETKQKAQVSKEIGLAMEQIYGTSAIKSIVAPKENSLTSFEYYSSSISSFMFIIVIMSLVTGFYSEKENGVFARIISASVSKYQYFNYSVACYFIFALLVNVIYVAAFKLMGLSFGGSVGLLCLIVLGKSLMEASIAGIVIAFFRRKMVATVFLNVIVMLTVTVGGTFAPVEKLGGEMLVRMSKFLPNTLIIDIYKNYLLHDSFAAISTQLAAFAGVAALLYVISIAKISIKWEA